MLQVKAHLNWRNTVIGLALLFLFVFVLLPLVVLVWKSFFGSGGSFSLENYLAVYSKSRNWDAVVMTVLVCGLTMLFSMAFAAASRGSWCAATCPENAGSARSFSCRT